ncbi:neuropeptide FF receptor 1 isoform X2 [Nematostella vectensis]|nr:neuropeptide FF receptor 1 isoform X2 [Nematostella vectensis]XP_048588133.1 neuropeptide FF receptor 1 isoform X2 [Nematostella vectensis]
MSRLSMTSNTATGINLTRVENGLNGTATSPVMNIELFRIIKLVLYAAIFLISAVGNTMVCAIIVRRKKMKTVTNYFILNLAVADLALTCICIPFDIPVQEMGYIWPYGAVMCKVLYPLQTLTLFASVYTLTAVGLTRYWAIVHPMKRQLSITQSKLVIAFIWLGSVVPVFPYANSLKFTRATHTCEEYWSSKKVREIFTAVIFVFQYVLPLGVIGTAYAAIGRELRRRKATKSGNHKLRHLQAQEARKVVNMLSVVTMVFAICVLPNNIMWLWLDFGDADQKVEYFWEIVAFCNVVTFANSAANPVCYTALNETYRREFKRVVYTIFGHAHLRLILRSISSRTTSFFTTSTKSNIANFWKDDCLDDSPVDAANRQRCLEAVNGYTPTQV